MLTGLRSFVNEIQYRQTVWKWMKDKWGHIIIIPEGKYSNNVIICIDKKLTPSYHSSLFITISDKPKFLISWSIDFSPEGIVQSSIQPYFTIKAKGNSFLLLII